METSYFVLSVCGFLFSEAHLLHSLCPTSVSGDPLPIVSPSPVSLHHSRCTVLSTWKRHISYRVSEDSHFQRFISSIFVVSLLQRGNIGLSVWGSPSHSLTFSCLVAPFSVHPLIDMGTSYFLLSVCGFLFSETHLLHSLCPPSVSGDPLPIVSPSPVSLHHSRCTVLSTCKRHDSY
jgi:hypothetical protein